MFPHQKQILYEKEREMHMCIGDCNTLQHATTRCNTLQHAATRCSTLQHAAQYTHHTHAYMDISACINIYTRIHTRTHTHTHFNIQIYICMYTHLYTHKCVCVCFHMYLAIPGLQHGVRGIRAGNRNVHMGRHVAIWHVKYGWIYYLRHYSVCCRVAVCCSVLQASNSDGSTTCDITPCVIVGVAVRCTVLQCVAVCCNVLQCVAGVK